MVKTAKIRNKYKFKVAKTVKKQEKWVKVGRNLDNGQKVEKWC